jgi:hypothetical protein
VGIEFKSILPELGGVRVEVCVAGKKIPSKQRVMSSVREFEGCEAGRSKASRGFLTMCENVFVGLWLRGFPKLEVGKWWWWLCREVQKVLQRGCFLAS